MNRKEMRELDCYLAEHVMGWQNDVEGSGYFYEETLAGPPRQIDYHGWQPTLDPAAAMMVLEKCAQKMSPDGGESAPVIEWLGDVEESWRVVESDHFDGIESEASSLELAICLFAKQLFHAQEKETQVH